MPIFTGNDHKPKATPSHPDPTPFGPALTSSQAFSGSALCLDSYTFLTYPHLSGSGSDSRP